MREQTLDNHRTKGETMPPRGGTLTLTLCRVNNRAAIGLQPAAEQHHSSGEKSNMPVSSGALTRASTHTHTHTQPRADHQGKSCPLGENVFLVLRSNSGSSSGAAHSLSLAAEAHREQVVERFCSCSLVVQKSGGADAMASLRGILSLGELEPPNALVPPALRPAARDEDGASSSSCIRTRTCACVWVGSSGAALPPRASFFYEACSCR